MTDVEDRMPWVPYYPAKLLGALAGMSADQQLVYQIVLLRIYETWAPCRDTVDALARRMQINRRRVAEALDALFKAGKISREGDGIMNPFASKVMAEAMAFRERQRAAGRKGGQRAAEKNKVNQSDRSRVAASRPQRASTQEHLQEQEDSLFPSGNRPSEPAPDERTKLFRDGLKTLVRITGKTESAARTFVGALLRIANDDAVTVRRVIEDAALQNVADPVSWIVGALKFRGGSNGRRDDARNTTAAADRAVEGLRSGAITIPPKPERPGPRDLLRGTGEASARLVPPERRK